MNDTVGQIVQWATIGLAGVCCPICIGVAICKCIMKRREKKAREEELKVLEEARAHQAKGGFNLSSSSKSDEEFSSDSENANEAERQAKAARKEQRR